MTGLISTLDLQDLRSYNPVLNYYIIFASVWVLIFSVLFLIPIFQLVLHWSPCLFLDPKSSFTTQLQRLGSFLLSFYAFPFPVCYLPVDSLIHISVSFLDTIYELLLLCSTSWWYFLWLHFFKNSFY